MIREAHEQIESQRTSIVSAIFSNPTWDEANNNRTQYIEQLNASFNDAITRLYYPKEDDGIDWNKPWYAAAKRGLERTRQKIAWALEGKTAGESIPEIGREQLEARERSRKEIDQR